MKQNVLDKLEWTQICAELSGLCHTEAARVRSVDLRPDLDIEQVKNRWRSVEPMRQLVIAGYLPPMAELADLRMILRCISVGQLITGQDLRCIFDMLMIIKNIHKFARDFGGKCDTLRQFHAKTYPLPRLMTEIEKTVDAAGELLDDASPDLKTIRLAKLSLRKKIESQLRGMFQDADLQKYLQDDFYTIRSERYVVPIKIDGRGRIKGSIYDTSDSGQTLFIEPTAIAPLNEQLLETELSEKIEILKIFRALIALLATELELLQSNYQEIVELDFVTAQARYAKSIDANPVQLSDHACIHLRAARHPLLSPGGGGTVVANDIDLQPGQCSLVISGPNAGGKTVVLKTVGMLQLMVRAGLMIPARDDSQMYLFQQIYLEMGDSQNISANLSTFSGHLMGIKPILVGATGNDLVLLDELAAGTEPLTGSALAQAILEDLVGRGCFTITTTHFDSLKTLPLMDSRFRNGSMEYSSANLKPTFRLVLDVPGQSYGVELAEQIGLSRNVIDRARELRGVQVSKFDELIAALGQERETLQKRERELAAAKLELESEKLHWQNEQKALVDSRRQVAVQGAERVDDELAEMRQKFEDWLENARKVLAQTDQSEVLQDMRQTGRDLLAKGQEFRGKLKEDANKEQNDLPGFAFDEVRVGVRVWVKSLEQIGEVVKVPATAQQQFEVRVGLMTVRLVLSEFARPVASQVSASKKSGGRVFAPQKSVTKQNSDIPFTIQTNANTVDLRGLESLEAETKMWRFIDQALRSGESPIVVIHGHGTNKLKNSVRDALTQDRSYQLQFRPGEEKEGGDGVTIVELR